MAAKSRANGIWRVMAGIGLMSMIPVNKTARELLVEKLVAHVGPELEQHVEGGVTHHLDCEFLPRGRQSSRGGRVVKIRNTRGHGIAEDLGAVEHVAARIVTGDQNARQGVMHTLPLGAAAFTEVTRVFVEHGWEDRLCEIVADGLI